MCQSPNPCPRMRRLFSQPPYHLHLLCRLNENSTRLLWLIWDCRLPQTNVCAMALLKNA